MEPACGLLLWQAGRQRKCQVEPSLSAYFFPVGCTTTHLPGNTRWLEQLHRPWVHRAIKRLTCLRGGWFLQYSPSTFLTPHSAPCDDNLRNHQDSVLQTQLKITADHETFYYTSFLESLAPPIELLQPCFTVCVGSRTSENLTLPPFFSLHDIRFTCWVPYFRNPHCSPYPLGPQTYYQVQSLQYTAGSIYNSSSTQPPST